MAGREQLVRALAQLPVIEREVYMLSALDGLDHSVIAVRLGIGIDAVEDLLGAAIVKLDRHLAGGAGE